ncbi:MAG: ParB/RepB/Spo0J family partition protein, partial [Rhodospirillales bacterium]|nr:ParB/RepB/Spo0J family partition protein [Rhodospirillales bacterium]
MAEDVKRKRLGRGLDALFSDSSDETGDSILAARVSVSTALAGEVTQYAAIESLQPGRYQPRRYFDPRELDELAESVKNHGVIQPILVRASADGEADYEIIAGERRWRAAQLAQLHDVPVLVRKLSDSEALEIALVENLQRENLSPLEEANGYRRLMDEFSHTQEALGDLLGKSRSHVANMMRLLSLPNEIKTLMETGKLSVGHGRALLGADDPIALARDVVKKGLNVRQTEKLVKSANGSIKSGHGKRVKDSDTVALEHDLAALLGLQVTIDFK